MIGAELQQKVAAEVGGLERVVRESGHRRQLARLDRREAVAVVEQRRADRQRRGQPVGRDHRAEHVAVRRRLADPEVDRGSAGGEEPGAGGDGLHQVGQLGLARRRRVEGRDAGEGLLLGRAGGEHPGLARAVERVRRLGRRPRGGGGRVGVGAGAADQHAAGHRGGGGAGRGPLEEVAAVDVHEESPEVAASRVRAGAKNLSVCEPGCWPGAGNQCVGGISSRSGTTASVSSSAPMAASTCWRWPSETVVSDCHWPPPVLVASSAVSSVLS